MVLSSLYSNNSLKISPAFLLSALRGKNSPERPHRSLEKAWASDQLCHWLVAYFFEIEKEKLTFTVYIVDRIVEQFNSII
jgi:hypothetical protein